MATILKLNPVKAPTLVHSISVAPEIESSGRAFIQANTIESNLKEIRSQHIIPVFVKSNDPLISQADFIDATLSIISDVFHGEQILAPAVRLSHPIKGRTPDAKEKPAHELLENEKTLYYERMAFAIEIPSIHDEIDGNKLSLTVGGVKAYSSDNLYNKKGADEHFKLFIGFQNRVCTNLCISTDGFMNDLKVKNVGQLKACIRSLFENYNATFNLHGLRELSNYSLTEVQFAQLIGRCRMYPFLPKNKQAEIAQLLFGDTQLGAVVKDYYRDTSFCKDNAGRINLWKLYNLFTGTNKSTYIDMFLERSVNAFEFVHNIKLALNAGSNNWYLG